MTGRGTLYKTLLLVEIFAVSFGCFFIFTMFVSIIAEFFKLKIVSDVIILSCTWRASDQVKLIRQLSQNGISATFSCDPGILRNVINARFTGVLYFQQQDERILEQVNKEYFSHWYKWLVIGQDVPKTLNNARYDADLTFINIMGEKTEEAYTNDVIIHEKSIFGSENLLENNDTELLHDIILDVKTNAYLDNIIKTINDIDGILLNDKTKVYLNDIYVHPAEGTSLYPWAVWTKDEGINAANETDRRKRRLDLKQFPLKIVTPVGHYYESGYNGSFTDYLKEDIDPQRDSGIRCTYILSIYTFEIVNASEKLIETHYWSSHTNNESMLRMVQYGAADTAGAYLRCLDYRIDILDYILPVWPFRVGFTYLSERESSSNMYLEPFTAGVWWCCFAFGVLLAVVQRITAKKPEEKEGAFFGVLATWLQQDASAVPEGASGRWSFLVMSVSSMLVHAYYTSAIVSSLMSTGRGGPESLRALADSKYAIASEDYDYMRYLFWDVDTNRSDLEYLKKKKMTSKLYVDMKRGVDLIRDGSTAYHTEYNQIYPHFKTFSDDQLCKLSYLDTIPEQLSWTTATKRSQYTNILRSSGARLHETGLVYREMHRLRMKPPPCRASLLAERVKFGDVAPLLGLTAFGAVVSCLVLGTEMLYAKLKEDNSEMFMRNVGNDDLDVSVATMEEFDYVD